MQQKMDGFDERQKTEQIRLNTLSENTDKRVADLVRAIGKLIEPLPVREHDWICPVMGARSLSICVRQSEDSIIRFG